MLGFGVKWTYAVAPIWLGDIRFADEVESGEFEAELGTLQQEQAPLNLKSFTYKLPGEFLGIRQIEPKQYEVWHTTPEPHGTREKFLTPLETNHFHGIYQASPTLDRSSIDFLSAQLALEEQLKALRYLGPLRQSPSRLYEWAGDIPEDVGLEGERTVDALLAARERQLTPPGATNGLLFAALIARWLQQMGILDSFEIVPIAPHRKEYEVLVRTVGMPEAVSLTDVGFGVSQLLPVLVQLLYVESGCTLIFEQPELHLHPRAQSALADVFIDALQMQEEGATRELQLLVESHSEHFLRRIQRRIAEEKLDPAQVALYFCKPGHEGSTIEELKLDEYGNISNWPENFFGDEIGDLAAMTEAAMKRQLGPGER
ncbi:AAA family ATPase [Cystobacter fuscus]